MNDTLSELQRLVEQITDLAAEGSYGTAVLMREEALDIIDKLQAQAAEPVAVAIDTPNHEHVVSIKTGAWYAKEGRLTYPLYTTPQPAAPAAAEGWQRSQAKADVAVSLSKNAMLKARNHVPKWLYDEMERALAAIVDYRRQETKP